MKKRNKLSLLGLIIILVLGPLAYFRFIKPKSTSAAWYATSGWYYRKALTIDYTKVSGGANLNSFPVLVSITDGSLKTNAQESGNDIMFTSSNGTTKLDHEIEKYTSSTGTLVAWVRIPTLSYTANTIIYMYYGNPGASDQSNKAAVWDASYVGVWHLAETSGHHIDSKGLQADSTAEGEISRTASGKANGAVLYNATGGLAWVGGFTLLGFFFGNLPSVKENFSVVVFAIIALSVTPIVFEFVKAKLPKK